MNFECFKHTESNLFKHTFKSMDGTGISYYLRGLVDLVVSPALHIFKCRYHILFDAPRQENTCLCRHSCLKLISNHNLHTPWREKGKRPSVGQKRLLFKLLRILAVVLVEVSADLCGESESGRHGQSDGGHFSEICTFSSEEILHVCPTVGLKTSTRLALQPKEFVKRVGIEIQKPLTWLSLLDM